MKKRIVCVILSLAAVFGLVGFNATQAWFSDGENNEQILQSGDLNFSSTGGISLKDKEALVLPGATLELEDAIVITNNSTIDTELRIRVECTYGDQTETFNWIEFVSEESDKWEINEEDGCIYYYPNGVPEGETDANVIKEARRISAPVLSDETPSAETTTVAEAATDEETTAAGETANEYAANEIPFAGTIKISEEVPKELINQEMTIKFIIEAKQADFMVWENFYNPNGMPTTTNATEAS